MGDAAQEVDLGHVERMVTLRSFPGWSGLEQSELALLAEIAKPRFAPAGATLVAPDEPCTHIFMIVRGEVEVSLHGTVTGRFGPGGAVGGVAAFAGVTDGYEIRVLEDATLLVTPVVEVEEVFEDRFPILANVLRTLAGQMIELRRRLGPTAGYPQEVSAGETCPARKLDLVQRIFYLRKNLAMDDSSIDSVAVLAKAAVEVRAAPGEVLWREGDEGDSMLAILCGRVRCTNDLGQAFLLGSGDLAGSLDSASEAPRWCTLTVEDGVVGLQLARDAMLDVWEDHPELPLRLLRAFSRQVLKMQEQVAT